MCGIAGLIDTRKQQNAAELTRTVRAMSDALAHRGPDSHGVWVDPQAGIALGHRRLAIIDLSDEGHQPMFSASGRYGVVFNGEVYNFRAMRERLETEGCRFRSHSDTEVLLAAIESWGLEKALLEANGMLALALWDKKERTLYLARDRLGKKPLYYGWAGTTFLFASELKAFHKYPAFTPEIDRDVLAVYCRNNYVPGPWSIYRNVYKLPPASYLSISPATGSDKSSPLPSNQYWSAAAAAETGISNRDHLTDEEGISRLEIILEQAVDQRMISDVPLGAFLSGGIDSSLIVALMQKKASKPIRTFSIGFEEAEYNEAEHARAIARHLNTDHTEFYVTAKEAQELVTDLPAIFDEPFADSSQIPTWYVSHLARKHVTVALSGDGGDEGFAGYNRYARAQRLANILKLPYSLRHIAAKVLAGRERVAAGLGVRDRDGLYRVMMSYWLDPENVVIGAVEAPVAMTAPAVLPAGANPLDHMMLADMRAYLPDDILAKVDRASMAVSLETRAPLLDYKVIEFSWRLPLAMKVRDGEGKWILRRLLERYVPPALFDRPKQGFGVPHASWLRGPLRDWAEGLLDEKRLSDDGLFDVTVVRKVWREHLNGKDQGSKLWGILMFQAWHERWGRP
jgi:asparagine synthase (glutamine-hydrolysing)